MTGPQMAAALESAMSAAILNGEGPMSTNGPVILARILAAYESTLMTVIWGSGTVSFKVPADYATITNYQVRLRANGSQTVIVAQDFGVPPIDSYGYIAVNITAMCAGQPPGSYTISVATTGPGGVTDSPVSAPFALPFT